MPVWPPSLVAARSSRCGAVLASLPESVLVITLVQALAKAEAMDLVVQKATELGVREILPVYSDHSVVKLDTERRERRVEHWNRIARSACEQSGRHGHRKSLHRNRCSRRSHGFPMTPARGSRSIRNRRCD